ASMQAEERGSSGEIHYIASM
ncbi:hypothetical protein PAT3040_00406, partial [Paenibacillus agaridevorans]